MYYYICMKVYRYLSQDELVAICSGRVDKLGSTFDKKQCKKRNQNNHRYKPNTRYLHFFKDKSSLEYIRRERLSDDKTGTYFFCSFNIPNTILFFHRGHGNYDGNYDIPFYSVTEYAIPVDTFDPHWLDKSIVDDRVTKHYDDTFIPAENLPTSQYKKKPWGFDLEL